MSITSLFMRTKREAYNSKVGIYSSQAEAISI